MKVPHALASPAATGTDVRAAARLGAILLDRGAVSADDLARALAIQQKTGARLGEVLTAHGLADEAAVASALARQWGLSHADLDADPPDPGLADTGDLETFLKYHIVPWRRVGKLTAYATSAPETAERALGELEPGFGMAFVVVVGPAALERATLGLFGARIARRAASITPAPYSVRSLGAARQGMLAALLAMALSSLVSAEIFLTAVGFLLLLVSSATTTIRLLSLMASRMPAEPVPPEPDTVVLAGRRPLPTMSILIPLYREAVMIPRIVAAIEAVDYPRERLEVKLLLEEDDEITQSAVAAASLPPWIQPLIVPAGQPRTKPRAMNAALDFCRGEIVGVLDAEDRPDPGQLRAVADHMQSAPRVVAAVQCQLAYFNARENWITRCFQIEYAIWFNVLLRGWQRLGLPIPLGGTSVYFRRAALGDLGGWDAHNVTEDADLGMRLARRGLRCDVLNSTTWEEANCRTLPWIRQRSRWLKGYMMTWLSHMRSPVALWRDLGPAGFLGFQVLFLGGTASYLAMPLFWGAVVLALASGQSVYGAAMPGWALVALAISLTTGQAVMLGSAVLALKRRRALDLVLWVPSLLIYWTMGAVAAWKAVLEIGAAPYYWDKTRHGITRFTSREGR